jgi:hypothetical protein
VAMPVFCSPDGKAAVRLEDVARYVSYLHLDKTNISLQIRRNADYSVLYLQGQAPLTEVAVFISHEQLRQLRDTIDAHLVAEYQQEVAAQ